MFARKHGSLLRRILWEQRRTIRTLSQRLDQEAQINDRQDTALTEAESRIADLEETVRQMRALIVRSGLRLR